jgi:hypothetical protein
VHALSSSVAHRDRDTGCSGAHPWGYDNSIRTAGSLSAARGAPALLGPLADAFFLGPGASLLITTVVFAMRAGGARAEAWATALVVGLTWVFIGPHYAATYRRAYSSFAIVRAHPWVTLAAPPLLLAAAALAVRHPYGFGVVYFGAYVAGTGYHYSGQSLGLALLYPLRQGTPLVGIEKRLIAAPLYVSWILTLLALYGEPQRGRNAAFAFVRGLYQGPPLPLSVMVVGLVVLVGSLAGVAFVAVRRARRGVPLPWQTYAVLATQLLWFTVGAYSVLLNTMLVPVFHSIQYLAFTGWHAYRAPTRPRWQRIAFFVVPAALLGLAIFPGSFNVLTQGRPYLDMFFMTAAVATFINLHHFLLDGRIWRMREPAVAQSLLA